MPDSALMTFVKVHDWVYRRTNGLIGHRMPGVPSSLMLHTIGAKPASPGRICSPTTAMARTT